MKQLPLGTVVALLTLTACGRPDEAPAADATTGVGPQVVSLSATEYAFDAPDTLQSGWTTFRLANLGHEIHYGHIVRLEPGRSVEELLAAYAEAIRTSGPRPKWLTRFGGPGGAAPGDTAAVTQLLEAGSYVWICPIEDESGAPHFGKGEFRSFVVLPAPAGDAPRPAAPVADLTIGLADYSFAVDPPPQAGPHTIRVHNAGVEPHDLVLLKLAPGRTLDDIRTWLNPERARRDGPSVDSVPSFESLGSGAGGIAAIGPGMESFFEADLTPGEYVMLCMATAPDGRSHIEHGMVGQFTVE